MRLKTYGFHTLIIILVIIAGIFLGTLGLDIATTSNYPNLSFAPAPVYSTNESGETYGSALYATSLETEPDLISARGVDGTLGYVRKVDLNGEMPETPEQALAEMRRWAGKVRQIPLYDVDGKTVIGVFNVGTENRIEVLEVTN
ncbi:hypothetical protein SY88_17350 [Clostridiales bacterium PH28_bin88]|nr:hypothetical protein SY88_17350 [Clostridiales bacterium PH28_bin88]